MLKRPYILLFLVLSVGYLYPNLSNASNINEQVKITPAIFDENNFHLNFAINSAITFTRAPKKIKESSGSKKTLTYYVVFENGKTDLTMAVKEKLDRIYHVYVSNPSDTLHISSQDPPDNLYKERSIAATNYLISKGLPSSHIRYIDFGKINRPDGIDLIIK